MTRDSPHVQMQLGITSFPVGQSCRQHWLLQNIKADSHRLITKSITWLEHRKR